MPLFGSLFVAGDDTIHLRKRFRLCLPNWGRRPHFSVTDVTLPLLLAKDSIVDPEPEREAERHLFLS